MMPLSRTVRALLVYWHVTIAGVLLSAVCGALAFTLVPAQYASASTAVLVQPNLPGSTVNPLATFDPSLNTTAMILVQALNSPDVAAGLGISRGRDSYTVKNAGSAAIGGGIEQPFISVSAQSPDPGKSVDIVAGLMHLAQQELVHRQNELRVTKTKAITLQSVVGVTAPQPVLFSGFATGGAVTLLGLVVTVLVCCSCAGRATRPAHSESATARNDNTSRLPVVEARSRTA